MPRHISYSEFSDWYRCPRLHNLAWIQRLRKPFDNIYTSFGKSCHKCAVIALKDGVDVALKAFPDDFETELKVVRAKGPIMEFGGKILDEKGVDGYKNSGLEILKRVPDKYREFFGNFEILSVEEPLMEPIEGHEDWFFKGFPDIIIAQKDPQVIRILDNKTSARAWSGKEKSKIKIWQLTLYKKFWAQKHQIPEDEVKTTFVFLMRALRDLDQWTPTNEEIRIRNALENLNNAVDCISSGICLKNRESCQDSYGGYCDFYKTQHCK